MALTYPLRWPDGVRRTPPGAREDGRFRTNTADAMRNVQKSLELFANESGHPLSKLVGTANVNFMGKVEGGEPGVALWFSWAGMDVCLAVDRYKTIAANLQALHHIIEARRVELRHGTLTMVRQTFAGFKAIAGPESPWQILGLPPNASAAAINDAWRAKAATAHPDKPGGSTAAMARLNEAKASALREVGA